MNRTRRILFGADDFLDLRELIQLPDLLPSHVYKCRVTYALHCESVEWELYKKPAISSLLVVQDQTINYSFKYRERHDLNRLYSQKGNLDDVLIVRNGYLTDTYVCNIALLKGTTWWTPADPLLKGTQRELLLRKNQLVEAPIHLTTLRNFQRIKLFNAMIPWSEAIELPCDRIVA